jgi:hypothetical protein
MQRRRLCNDRPRTEATWEDVKGCFRKHPVKTALILPVAFIALGFQMVAYYITTPFAAANKAVSNL